MLSVVKAIGKQIKGGEMPRPRVFKGLVSKDAKQQPAIRIVFKGNAQLVYHAINRIAREEFETNQTDLARKILTDWVKAHQSKPKEKRPKQMNLILEGKKNVKAKTKA